MDGDIVLLGRGGEGERMILPDGNLRATEENVLTSSRLGIFLLDLNFAHVAGMLNHLGDVRLVLSSDLSCDSFGQVDISTIHPVLPEYTNGTGSDANAVGSEVGLDHAESPVDGPEQEEDDEHVVSIPEPLEVGTAHLLHRSNHHAHESDQHDISRPAGARDEVGHQPSTKTQVVLGRDLGKVVPVRNGVYPGEEDN